jgi:DNA-binding transcriptional LysR family regulator
MSSEPDWTLYRTFLTVAKLGSLSAAARSLGLTQPTVARHVESLEAELEVDLFLRSPRGLLPTDIALALLPQAEAIAASASTLLRTAASGKGEMTGSVRVSASEVMGVERLPPVLAALRLAHPRLDIQLVLSDGLHDLLTREADVAVRQTVPTQGALFAKKLPPTEIGLYAHASYLKRRGVPQSLGDLAQHDVIGFDRHTPAVRDMLQRFPDIENARFALRTDNDLAKFAAVRAGLGVGVMQVGIAARDASLKRVLADQLSIQLPLWIVMHEDLKSSAICRAVFDALAVGLSEMAVKRRPPPPSAFAKATADGPPPPLAGEDERRGVSGGRRGLSGRSATRARKTLPRG